MPKISSKIAPSFEGPALDADRLAGQVPVASGGTGVASLPALKTSLALDNVDNTRDADKPLSFAQSNAIANATNVVTTALDQAVSAAQTARDEAMTFASATVKESYAQALAIVGMVNGDSVLVMSSDIGTHASIAGDFGAVSGQTPNAGYYIYSGTLSTLVRVADLESTAVRGLRDQVEIDATRTEAFSTSVTTLLDSYVSQSIAEGLADADIPNGSFFPVITSSGHHYLVEKVNGTTSGTVVEYNTVAAFNDAEAAVLAARDEAMAYGSAKVVASWTDANALTGLANGAAVFVLSVDTGTHTSVAGDYGASGGVTPNSGYYLYSTALSKLVRKAPTESAIVATLHDDTVVQRNLAQAYSTALATMFDGFIYRTTAEGLADTQVPNDSFFSVITVGGKHYAIYKDNTGAAGQTIEYATTSTVTDLLNPVTGAGQVGYSFGTTYTASTVGKELQNIGSVVKYTYTGATNGTITFEDGGTKHARVSGETSFNISHVASAVNYVNLTPGTTTNPPVLAALGTDANINFRINAKGTGFFASYGAGAKFYNAAGNQVFNIADMASAANYISANANTATNAPSLSAAGSDTNINLQIVAKGTGYVATLGAGTRVLNAAGGQLFNVSNVASPANYLSADAGAAGAAAGLSAAGSDANINMQFTPKGTGVVVLTLANVPNYASDSAAATGGVPIGGIYRNGSALQIRAA